MSKKKKSERKGMTRKQEYEYMVHHAESLDLFEIVDQGLEHEYGFIKFLNEGLSPKQKRSFRKELQKKPTIHTTVFLSSWKR